MIRGCVNDLEMHKLKQWFRWTLQGARRIGQIFHLSQQLQSSINCLTTENQRCEKGFLDMRQGKHKVFIDILIEGTAINPEKTD